MNKNNGNSEFSIRIFVCRYCGKVVVAGTDRDKKDKRSVFCCSKCERKFWKKGPSARIQRIQTAEARFEELREFINSNKENF